MADKGLKNTEDPSTKQLNQFVQNLLKQMQQRFEDMSSNIINRIDEMGNIKNKYRKKDRRYLKVSRIDHE